MGRFPAGGSAQGRFAPGGRGFTCVYIRFAGFTLHRGEQMRSFETRHGTRHPFCSTYMISSLCLLITSFLVQARLAARSWIRYWHRANQS